MKRSRALTLVLIAQTPVLLAGCDQAPPEQLTRKGFYTDIAACEKDGNAADVCQRAFNNAAQANNTNAPKFKTREECIAEFGEMCQPRQNESGFWSPLMTGFLLSQLLSPGRSVSYLDAYPIYRTRTGQFTQYTGYGSGGGYSSSSYHPVDIAPNRAVTVSRSGFGSVAAARSGWGGSSSRRSSSGGGDSSGG
jgi:uncharacterized protein YgiB involved in biofilm formation